MRYFLSIFCPPLAVLLCGKPFQAIINVFLTFLFWYPGVRHAQFVVWQYFEEQRNLRLVRAVDYPKWAMHVYQAPKDQKLKLPKMKKTAELSAPKQVNDPTIGEHGTVFRKKVK